MLADRRPHCEADATLLYGWPLFDKQGDCCMPEWNFADVYEAVAAATPDAPARSRAIGSSRGVSSIAGPTRSRPTSSTPGSGHQSKVAAYLYNGPEYLQVYVAAFKAGLAPVNTNYRYGPEEIVYLFDNADAEAVVFHATYGELLEQIHDRLPKVRRWYVVADGTAPAPDWATPYEDVVAAAPIGSRRRGVARATTSCCSTPAAPPACPRA